MLNEILAVYDIDEYDQACGDKLRERDEGYIESHNSGLSSPEMALLSDGDY